MTPASDVQHMDDVFRALADPSRRALLDSLDRHNGQTLGELCGGLDMARQSVSKHLAVLEAANLVTTRRRGREKLHFLNAAPINAIADRWINHYDRRRAEALADLKTALESTSMNTTPTSDPANEFVYTTYIKTTPQQLWQALTDPAFTVRYWGVELTSDWKVGSAVTLVYKGVTMNDPMQTVLVADENRRLSYNWHTITPEFGELIGSSPRRGRRAGCREAFERALRDRGDGRVGEADRDPWRLPDRQPPPRGHLGRLADHPGEPQDAVGDRRTAGLRG